MESVNAMNSIMTWGIALCGGIIAIFLVMAIVKDGIEFASGRGNSMVGIIGKCLFLILMIGLIFMSRNLPELTGDNSDNIVDNVTYENVDPNTNYEISSEVITEQPTEAVTETPTTEAQTTEAAAMSDKEFADKWSYALKHEYDFYYMSTNGNSVKRNPAYIDYSLYRVEFDDTNHIVRLYDK